MIYIINPASRKHKEVMHTYDQPSLRLPYGSAVLTTYLKSIGHDVKLIDLRQEVDQKSVHKLTDNDFLDWIDNDNMSKNLKNYLLECEIYINNLESIKIFGISIFSYMEYGVGISLAKYVKRLFPDITICIGGPHITIKEIPDFDFVDFSIRGFGNKPLGHIANHILKK